MGLIQDYKRSKEDFLQHYSPKLANKLFLQKARFENCMQLFVLIFKQCVLHTSQIRFRHNSALTLNCRNTLKTCWTKRVGIWMELSIFCKISHVKTYYSIVNFNNPVNANYVESAHIVYYRLYFRHAVQKDKSHVFMLLEYSCGGELFTYLRSAGR